MGNPYEQLKQYEGQWLKYPQLCEICGENQKTGKSKRLQLKKIGQYVDIKREGGKLYVAKVYNDEDALQVIENYGRYTTHIRQFLINLFAEYINNTGETEIVLTNRDILEQTCMVNNNYFIGKNAPYKFQNSFDVIVNQEDIPNDGYVVGRVIEDTELFLSGSYRLLKRIIQDSLTTLENMSLIKKGKTFRLYSNYKDQNGVWHSDSHDCTPEEESRVLLAQRNAIDIYNAEVEGNDSLKIKQLWYIRYLPRRNKNRYYQIYRKQIEKEFPKWNACSTAWKLTLAQPEVFNYKSQQVNYGLLNHNVQQKLLTAKDLQVIANTLRAQLIDTFIKIENND